MPYQFFFAPDGEHGWLVNENSNDAMILRTNDGGQSWEDISGGLVEAAGSTAMHGGFALDADRIFVGGESGTLYYHEGGGVE